MTLCSDRRVLLSVLCLALACSSSAVAAIPKVPDDFEVRTVATVPAVTYPCQVATAPDGALFIAEDPMDQVGPYEADLGRILLFREGHEPVVHAEGFRAIFGMAWYEGSLYVMNMPRLTVLKDKDGDGKADERKDLFTNLGPGPHPGALNDHIVSGLQFGMDGFLYIAVGDKGVPGAKGPDGREVQLKGGGTLRCRPDGTELEVFTSGTRNHLEPNLDDRDRLFTYDNTDDGDGWWTRVTYHIESGYYGYPYDYHRYKDRMLPRIAEYGGGSPCGGVVYKEDVWPEKYRNRAFWAEWGKGKVQAIAFEPAGASFKVGSTYDFATPNGVQNFKPIDLALSYDGRTLYVADWGMGGWGSKTEKVGRVFAITYKGEVKTAPRGSDTDPIPAQIKSLAHASFNERMRAQRALIRKGKEALTAVTNALAEPKTDPIAKRHLVWALDNIAGGTPEASLPLVEALHDATPDVRAQAARALGVRRVPIAVEPLDKLLNDSEPAVRLQAEIALGRIGSPSAVPHLLPALASEDTYLAFAARQAIRRIGDWKAAAAGLKSDDAKVRAGTLAAMEQQYDLTAAQALAQFVKDPKQSAGERARALTCLASAHRKTKPWDGHWWGTRPTQGKPPAKEVDWEGTTLVLKTVRTSLGDKLPALRLAAVSAAQETNERSLLEAVRTRFKNEPDVGVRQEMARGFGAANDKAAIPLLVAAVRETKTPEPVREAALLSIEQIGGDEAAKALVGLLARTDLAPEHQPGVIAALGRFRTASAVPGLLKKLKSPSAEIRAAAAQALGRIGKSEGVSQQLLKLLDDRDLHVRRESITALGALHERDAIPAILRAAEASDTHYEACMALAEMPDMRALQIYLKELGGKSPALRKAAARALGSIRDQAAPVLDQLAQRNELPASLVPELKNVFTAFQPIAQWQVIGPLVLKETPAVDAAKPVDLNKSLPGAEEKPVRWQPVTVKGEQNAIDLAKLYDQKNDQAAYGYAELVSPTERKAQMTIGSDDTFTVWLNGKQVYDFENERGFEPEQAKFDVALEKGVNRILVKCGNRGGAWMFRVAVTAPTDYAFLNVKGPGAGGFDPEAFRAFALKGKGKPEHGRALFSDEKGLGCIKCHAVGSTGGNVGPELASVGAKYSRDELITSVLNPSQRISSGYEAVVIATADGRVITGLLKSETPQELELADADAKRIQVPKSDVEERKPSSVSLMPNGLVNGLSQQDFADLIAYLETLKEMPAGNSVQPGGGR